MAMKTAIVVYQDTAGEGVEALDGRSLLQSARVRTATELVCRGCGGWVAPPAAPHRLLAQACGISSVRTDALRRGAVEAWLLDCPPAEGDLVYCVDLVAEDHGILCSIPSPGTGETHELTAALTQGIGAGQARFECLDRGALILTLSGEGEPLPEGLPTEQALGHDRVEVMPSGRGAARLRDIMRQAGEILSGHPVNEIRVDLGEDPANGIWIHGGGRWPDAAESAGPVSSTIMLTETPVGRGIARMLGLPSLPLQRSATDEGPWFHVPDLVAALHEHDSLVVDVVLRREGGAVDRVRELDRIDEQVLAPLHEIVAAHRPYRLVLLAAASRSSAGESPQSTPLPLLISGDDLQPDATVRWDETACIDGALGRVELESFVRQLRGPP